MASPARLLPCPHGLKASCGPRMGWAGARRCTRLLGGVLGDGAEQEARRLRHVGVALVRAQHLRATLAREAHQQHAQEQRRSRREDEQGRSRAAEE